MKEYEYSEGSWELVTQAIKQHLGIDCLTKQQASAIMALYLKAIPLVDIIKEMEEVK